MNKKIGISIGGLQGRFGDREALAIAKRIGADAVDFSLDKKGDDYRIAGSVYSKSDEEIAAYFRELGEYARELGLVISQTHGKITGFRDIREEDDALVENIRRDCLATAALGAPVCVIHNATSIYHGPNPDPALMQKMSYELFSRTLPYAKQYGIKIATETFGDAVQFDSVDFFGDIDEFMKAYLAIKSDARFADYLTVCADTGHSNKAMRFGNPTAADVIRRIGSDVTVLHLNDNDTLTDQHKIPMTGCIDWNDVFDALDEVGYRGVYNMEINLSHFGEDFAIEEARFAVLVMKHLLKTRYGA